MSVSVSKTALVEKLAAAEGITKVEAARRIDAVLGLISAEVAAGNAVALKDFGTFSVKERAARQGINPKTKEPLQIAASKTVGFKAAKSLKASV